MTTNNLVSKHNTKCHKLKDFKWLGCPYPQLDIKTHIKFSDLYKCNKCGLVLLKIIEVPKNKNDFTYIWYRKWLGSDTNRLRPSDLKFIIIKNELKLDFVENELELDFVEEESNNSEV